MIKTKARPGGLTKKIGNTGFSVTRGAHYPWGYLLCFDGVAIAGIDADNFFPIIRNHLENSRGTD